MNGNKQTVKQWEEQEALRRFQLIFPLLQPDLDNAKKLQLRKQIADMQCKSYWVQSPDDLPNNNHFVRFPLITDYYYLYFPLSQLPNRLSSQIIAVLIILMILKLPMHHIMPPLFSTYVVCYPLPFHSE